MTECVILVRMPNGAVVALTEGEDQEKLCVFPHIDDAIKVAANHILCENFPHQIVELDEL